MPRRAITKNAVCKSTLFRTSMEERQMYTCQKCGKVLDDNVKFCPECGAQRQETVINIQAEKKPTKKRLYTIAGICWAVIMISGFAYAGYQQHQMKAQVKNTGPIYYCPHCGSTDIWAGQKSDRLQNFKCNYCHCGWADYWNGLREIYRGNCILR